MDKDFAAGVTLTNQAILDQFAALPLTTRMRAAAKLFPQIAFQDNNAADAMIVGAVVCQQLGSAILPVTQYRIEVIEKLGD